MLQNAYFLAEIGADTAENEQHFAEIWPIGRRVDPPRPEPQSAARGRRLRHHGGRNRHTRRGLQRGPLWVPSTCPLFSSLSISGQSERL